MQLETWTRLANIAFEDKDHQLVVKCSNKALAFATAADRQKSTAAAAAAAAAPAKKDAAKQRLEKELLCYASCILGQSLVDTMMGKNSIRKQVRLKILIFSSSGNKEQ